MTTTPASEPSAITPRLRVAPSPTGDPHVGTAYMALFNLAFVRKHGGRFVLRVEDTDRARFREDSEAQLFDTLDWLGLNWDEGPDVGGPYAPYRQSERLDTYAPYIDRLIESGHAYYCWCSSERLKELRAEQERSKSPVTGYDRLCHGKTREERAQLPGFSETPVVRMLIPDDVPLEFDDLIRGTLKAPRPDDQVIRKADGFPTYHMAVVVDDHEMGITHVVRGEEWISSTPKHLLLYRWLGLPEPKFAHMPLLRNANKSKISKRKNPEARLTWFRDEGYLPEALVNFLALLGYPPIIETDDDGERVEREMFSFEEFSDGFEWNKVNPVGPVFDLTKLDWLNGMYVRELPTHELAARLLPYLVAEGVLPERPDLGELGRLEAITALIQPRLTHLTKAGPQVAPFYAPDDAVPVADDARGQLKDDAPAVLDAAVTALEGISTEEGDIFGEGRGWTHENIEAALRAALVEGLGLKPKFAFGPLRTAISGQRVSPPLFESMEILGRHSTLTRLRALRATL
ncbi:glutamate--tRNA ligase [Mobilicoccus pelagius]|uniref:Glutamate--tRNA ligase n=1 Tax=Mobilicoccus pelagius NBRC 104925 TaxID=1089455 RepID=H5UNH5_9MICO|nr:glutamate--tRNA ligase [Mobilicoccus pelagius]GAB47283.1 glutamyl-tRNA synthetase [Mobilicoccus pelagius NBRC 104925]